MNNMDAWNSLSMPISTSVEYADKQLTSRESFNNSNTRLRRNDSPVRETDSTVSILFKITWLKSSHYYSWLDHQLKEHTICKHTI